MKQLYFSMLFALIPLSIFAQNTITGTITDADSGAPLEQVSVYIPQLENGTVTDETGHFTLKNLPEGNYKLVISYIGFETYSATFEIASGTNNFDYQMVASAIEMDEVVLSTPFHKLQRENVMKVEQKSMEELKQQGGITLSEGITNIPGVSSVSTGVGIGKPVIRGLSFNRVLVYTQGVRLENQQYGGEHGLGINDAGISSVEVIKGPASLLYGSDALGGVLYLNPEKFETSGETSGDVNMRYFTNTLGYNANAGFKTSGEKLKFLVRGAYASNADYETGNGTSVTNSRFNEADLKTGLAYQASKFKTELRYNYNASELGIPEEIGVQNNDREPLEPYQELSTHIISSKNSFFFKKSSLDATFGYTINNRKEFEEHHHEEEEGEVHEEEEHEEEEGAALDMRLSTFNYNIQFNPHWGKMTTIFGIQGMHQKNENFGEEVLVPDAITNDFGVLATSHIHFDKSDLQLGLRYDIRSLNGEASGIEGDEEYIPALDKNFSSFNAAVGYRMDLTQNIMGRLNLATGFRAPNLSELSSNGLHSGANRVEIGNQDLDSEQNFQIDLAFEYANKHVEAYVNTFYNIVNDYIYLEPKGEFRDLDPVYDFQQQNAILYGGEFGFHLHPHPIDWLHLESSYDIVFGELDDNTNLPLIPANRWTNTFRVEWKKRNQDYKCYAFVTVQTNFDQNKVAEFETPTSRYNLFNIGVGGDMKIFNQKVGYSITGNNIFDKDYISHLSRLKADGISNIGRNISLNLSVPL
ncbi:TonB-dependent receptor [Flagellimonas zhangzhouensis]|uniref:Iron complex outermembrane recepter protein n=1 Tax=Flagellimonas zhangzhouensis TaxID=1073328 RepID=A0A1H2SQR3_9FLAO|nr:TonB-dependent receptor [Allomuricauda zhangzhouensis]SDQ77953.1 iron complex outermembrane recepter protein [Allomuricauda zhangzhouensis]SDW33940.1 iron complex outermembrane recepter protein [Allomuricauda zhangzhouensis]